MQVISPYRVSGTVLAPSRTAVNGQADVQAVRQQMETVSLSGDEPAKKEGWGSRLANAAALTVVVAGGAASGMMAPTLASNSMVLVAPATTKPLPPAPKWTTEKPSQDIHFISHIDATEKMIEPMATADLHQFDHVKSYGGSHVTVDVSVDRKAENPAKKMSEGIVYLAVTAAPWYGARYLSKKAKNKSAGAAMVMLGAMGSFGLATAGGFAMQGIQDMSSGAAALRSSEPLWSGHRTYQLNGSQNDRVLTSSSPTALEEDGKDMGKFIGDRMKAYPQGTTVVHMVGHGLGYRYSSGLPYNEYQRMLANATNEAGRPIDVLVVESCLEGNLESISGIQPYARYAVVSEEEIAATTMGDVLQNTMKDVANQNLTPRELGTKIVNHSSDLMYPKIDTLVLVDMSQVPALNASVDKLGSVLLTEVQDGRSAPIKADVNNTPDYPKPGLVDRTTGKLLGMGDLKVFSQNVLQTYGGDAAHPGDPTAMASPHAAEVRAAAQGVLDNLDHTVLARHTTSGYSNAGGISVQMPNSALVKVEQRPSFATLHLDKFHNSAAPQNWQKFVDAMGSRMN